MVRLQINDLTAPPERVEGRTISFHTVWRLRVTLLPVEAGGRLRRISLPAKIKSANAIAPVSCHERNFAFL
jgi:hypothetical protein